MAAAGDTVDIADSAVDADFRPDDVPVTWREDPGRAPGRAEADRVQGAEATVSVESGEVTKRRAPRDYRHPELDARLRRERTRREARLLHDARAEGVPTPVLGDVDPEEGVLTMERVGDRDLRANRSESRVRAVARHLATLHRSGIVHGDPTTRNVRLSGSRTYLLDFGLGYNSHDAEDHAMDLHVLGQSLAGTAENADTLLPAVREAYAEAGERAVLDRLDEIEGRGRYR